MKAFLAAVIFMLAAALPVSAAPRAPVGFFTMTGDFVEGNPIVVDVTVRNVNERYEVTLGTWCFQPDGTQMRIGNLGNPYIYEMTSIRGKWIKPQTLVLWVTGTGYSCTSRLIAAYWPDGYPVAAWTLDEKQFVVGV